MEVLRKCSQFPHGAFPPLAGKSYLNFLLSADWGVVIGGRTFQYFHMFSAGSLSSFLSPTYSQHMFELSTPTLQTL